MVDTCFLDVLFSGRQPDLPRCSATETFDCTCPTAMAAEEHALSCHRPEKRHAAGVQTASACVH